MVSKKKKILIVGAGPGGCAAAMLLAHAGHDVEVYEKNACVGGRTSELQLGPYKFDLGPTFLMMKYLLDELFTICGRKTSDYLSIYRLDPMYELIFNNKSMQITGNLQRMKDQIEAHFPGESIFFDKFMAREKQRFEKLYPCLQKDFSGIHSYLSVALLKAFPHIALGRSLYDVLSDYFKSDELRLALTFQAKYLGMSPWDCPGLFTMIPYTEHAHGIHHVEGGLNQIPTALAKVAQEEGAKFHFSTSVKRILVEGRKTVGVELENGERIKSDDVVVNADFGTAVTKLFPVEKLKKWTPTKLKQKKFSCSTFMLYLGLDKVYESQFHTIVFSKDYRKNLHELSKTLQISNDPSIYIRNASILDRSLAPSGHSALYILAPVPNNFSEIDWDKEKSAFRDRILTLIEERTSFKNLNSHIKMEQIVTPKDWENDLGVYQGATFNLSHNLNQMMHLRPHNAFEEFDNCYLVGGGTNPGSGLPTIFESARLSSNLICEKYGKPLPRPLSLLEAINAPSLKDFSEKVVNV